MDIANYLALFWGFSFAIMGLAFLARQNYIEKAFRLAEDENFLLFSGLFNVMLGIALILLYNNWQGGWKSIISLLGWLVLAKGAVRLFFPEWVMDLIRRAKANTNWAAPALLVVVIAGCALILLGFNG